MHKRKPHHTKLNTWRTVCCAFCCLLMLCAMPLHVHAQRAVISGIVSEAVSGEAVIGVNVALYREGTTKQGAVAVVRGARTNKFGFYSIPALSAGRYELVVRGIGFKPFTKLCVVGDTLNSSTATALKINIPLQFEASRTGEVTVQAEREQQNSTRTISSVEMTSQMVKSLPALGGEADAFRALQLMPGVKSSSEISSGLYVRGGSPDQNLTLLDGVVVYNPSHLGGLLSVFNNDALRDVRLIKGAFPAEYGSRISSVVDLTMKEGTKEKFSGTGGLSLINSRLTLEGPITEDCSFMVSGRRMYLDLIAAVLPASLKRLFPTYYFYDVNAKLNYRFSENDRVYVSGYAGYDVLQQPTALQGSTFDVNWGNAIANMRWMHVVNDALFTNFSAMFTNYDFSTSIGTLNARGETDTFQSISRIRDWTVRADAQWFPDAAHTVKFGAEAIYHQFLGNVNATARFSGGGFTLDSPGGSRVESLETALYAQDEWQITPQLSTNLGVRLSHFQRGQYFNVEPRVSASYALTDEVSVKGAFAVANQYIHLIIRNDIGVPSDVWFPATENILPARGTQYVLGAEAQLFDKEWLVSVEGYYKGFQNLYEFKDDAQFSLLAPVESQFTRGTGEAYGVEFFVNKRMGQWTGWVGYTLSWAWRTFADLNEGRAFAPRFDRRHDVSVVVMYKLNDIWEFSATWVYGTGQAFTMPAAQFDFVQLPNARVPTGNVRPRLESTERNGFRLPPFHKLDVSAIHHFSWFGLPFTANFSIYNAYNRANPFTWNVRYRQETLPNGTSQQIPSIEQLSLFPIIPTVGIGFTF